MKKTRGFLLAAGLVLAMAFTFSCSSDDGGSPSGGGGATVPSTEPDGYQTYEVKGVQVYEWGEDISPYARKAKLNLQAYPAIEVGEIIEGGKLSLELERKTLPDSEDGYSRQYILLNVDGRNCNLMLAGSPNGIHEIKSEDERSEGDLIDVGFVHSSQGGVLYKGITLKKGWNFVYSSDGKNHTLDAPPGLTWEWFIGC